MANSIWCRHYNGVANSDTCKAGVKYDEVVDKSERPYRWPCTDPTVRNGCSQFAAFTQAEIDDTERKVAAIIDKMDALWERRSDICPHCGQKVTSMHQVGRCVYSSCGCRQGQGKLPAVWGG
jgi:hypothetical protein